MLDQRMLRRRMTHRIGGAGITRKEESLAAASAKILIAPRHDYKAPASSQCREKSKKLASGAKMSASECSRTFRTQDPG
jgi:hypothetical protein